MPIQMYIKNCRIRASIFPTYQVATSLPATTFKPLSLLNRAFIFLYYS